MTSFHHQPTTSHGRRGSLRSSLAVGAVVALGAILWVSNRSEGLERPTNPAQVSDATPAPPAPPIQSLGVQRLIRAIPFELVEPYTHRYRVSQPNVRAGWLVVLGVDPELVHPTNDFQPVLYAGLPGGAQTLERFNQGHLDGVTIAFLPRPAEAAFTLEDVPFWFGAPELPERLTDGMIATEAERIEGQSVFTATAAALRAAEPKAGAIVLANRTLLEETAAELVLQYAPGERSLAESYLIE